VRATPWRFDWSSTSKPGSISNLPGRPEYDGSGPVAALVAVDVVPIFRYTRGSRRAEGVVMGNGDAQSFDHEVRLALVLNGGVSLAVWMGGVAHELDLLRRATADDSLSSKAYDVELVDLWKRLLQPEGALERRKVVIDVIAGTSAGGLNGAMLATVIGNGGTMDPPLTVLDEKRGEWIPKPDADQAPWLREQWASLGSLRTDALIPPENDDGYVPTGSVLDGGYFLSKAAELIDVLASYGAGHASPAPDHGHPERRVTLFTPASSVQLSPFTAADAGGQEFDFADHRMLFRFRSQGSNAWAYSVDRTGSTFAPDTANDFVPPARAVSLAARASASFPTAFQPVLEATEFGEDGADQDVDLRNYRVRPAPGTADDEPVWLMDGGVLDNAPFGPVLDAVARSPVDGHTSRYVVYVVPSGGTAHDRSPIPTTPPTWSETLTAAVNYPREVDFRSDVEQLEALLRDADAGWSDAQRMFDRACADEEHRDRVLAAAAAIGPEYARGRAGGTVWEAVVVARGGRTTSLDATAAVEDDEVDAILALNPAWAPNTVEGSGPAWGSTPDGLWGWGVDAAERACRLILRRIRARLTATYTAVAGYDAESVADLQRLLVLTSDIVSKLVAVRDALARGVRESLGSPVQDGLTNSLAIAAMLDNTYEELRVKEAVTRLMAELQDGLGDAAPLLPPGDVMIQTALAVEIVSHCASSRAPSQRSVPFKFVRLGPDLPLPLLEDPAVPPEVRSAAVALGDQILYGTQLGHFGGFGAEDWRRWDWLVGRLHAVAHLGYLLHGQDKAAASAWITSAQLRVLIAEGWADRPDDPAQPAIQGVRIGGFCDKLVEMSTTFVTGDGGPALGVMIEELNDVDADVERTPTTTHGVIDRLLYVSNGFGPKAQAWVQAIAADENRPDMTRPQRIVRWLVQPSRAALWQRLTGPTTMLEEIRPPALLRWEWIITAFVAGGALIGGAVALEDGDGVFWPAALFVVAGLVLAVGMVMLGARLLVDHLREAVRQGTGTALAKLVGPSGDAEDA
jgi:patatin-related protein